MGLALDIYREIESAVVPAARTGLPMLRGPGWNTGGRLAYPPLTRRRNETSRETVGLRHIGCSWHFLTAIDRGVCPA